MTCPTAELFDHAYGLLDAPSPMPEHASVCPGCADGLDRLRRERDLLGEALRDPRFQAAVAPRRRPGRGWRWLHAGYAAALVLGLFGVIVLPRPHVQPRAVSAPALGGPQEDDTAALIRQLGADDFDAREKAAEALVRKGLAVEPELRKAMEDDDTEVRARARGILARIKGLRARDLLLASRGKLLGARLGGKRAALLEAGGDAATEDAVLIALKWLSRHQSPDGSWEAKDHSAHCGKPAKYAGTDCVTKAGTVDYTTGVTGLAVLAFAGAGYTHLSKDTYDGLCFGDVVRLGIQWMLNQQNREGCIGSTNAPKHIYNHALATLALCEVYALSRSKLFEDRAEKAVRYLVSAQNPGLGWRYSSRSGDNDTSVTTWAALALRVAWHAKIDVPDEAFTGAVAWLDAVTDPAWGRAGYTHRGTGKVFVPGMNENFHHHETLSGAAAFVRMILGTKPNDALIRSATDFLLRDKPSTNDPNGIDYYYWHLGTLALFQHDGPSGERWKQWNGFLKEALLKSQSTPDKGCKSGSWEPTDRWGPEGGRVYATALNALTLETYYRYAPVPRD